MIKYYVYFVMKDYDSQGKTVYFNNGAEANKFYCIIKNSLEFSYIELAKDENNKIEIIGNVNNKIGAC